MGVGQLHTHTHKNFLHKIKITKRYKKNLPNKTVKNKILSHKNTTTPDYFRHSIENCSNIQLVPYRNKHSIISTIIIVRKIVLHVPL